MAQKEYIVEGRRFRTESDYKRASRDKEIIDKLRKGSEQFNVKQLEKLLQEVKSDRFHFMTVLGQDFQDELEEQIRKAKNGENVTKQKKKSPPKSDGGAKPRRDTGYAKTTGQESKASETDKAAATGKASADLDHYVQQQLRKRERFRKRLVALSAFLAVGCLGYVAIYSYFDYRTQSKYESLTELKEKPAAQEAQDAVVIHYADETTDEPEILDEYKNIFNKNKKLIGWLKIDDTNIDYPVVQTSDNEYYLDHNLNQEYDKNGSIFMDKDCDVRKPSMNLILYGHHMRSGQMFGKLDLYEKESYYLEHPVIRFDTIYEKGTYQVMYAFRSKVYSEEEIVFKYYQFIDAMSEQEFDSNMQEMAAVSLYDTGVTARYGDRLLTLSTCDYQEKNGRFVVVAKRIDTEKP